MNIADVRARCAEIAQDQSHCFNGTIIHYSFQFTSIKQRKKTLSYTDLTNFLISRFGVPDLSTFQIIPKVRQVIARYGLLTKAVTKASASIESFISEEFVFPRTHSPPPPPETQLASESLLPRSPLKLNQSSNSATVTTPVKTRQDCNNCSASKKVNIKLNFQLKSEKSQHFRLKCFSADVKRKLNLRSQKQTLVRNKSKIQEQKVIIQRLNKTTKGLHSKNIRLNSEKSDLLKKNRNLEKSVAQLQEKLFSLKSCYKSTKLELDQLKKYSENLEHCLKEQEDCDSEQHSDKIATKNGKCYNSEIRRLVYHELVCDVPVNHCGYLLNVFSKVLCGKELKDVPCPSTCAQMAYELGVITTVQVMDYMLSSQQNICLSWDATTIDGQHVNEIHLTVNRNTCLMMDVRLLPGGTAADYVTHIVTSLTDAAELYAKFRGQPVNEILFQLKTAVTSTLTDRAAVNACVTRQLCDQLDTQLVMLNCNIHPLDSVARQAKQSLIKLDVAHEIKGSCFGSEGSAANLINAISTLRFKDGKGDPCGFKNMLRNHNLPVGTFVRYVGNRIHVLFHLAGTLVLHWSKVKDFVEKECTAAGLLKSSLLKDLANEKIMAQVWALGVLGKVFSGPWMTKFYSSDMSNLEMRPYVRLSEEQLQNWLQAPNSLFSITANIFGEQLSPLSDAVLPSLQNFVSGAVDIQVESLSALLNSALIVIQRQLKDFLNDDEPSTQLVDSVSSAPTHNMASERGLGCLDKMMRRAPIATGGFLSGKVRSKLNKCTLWLDSQPSHIQKRLTDFALRQANEERIKRIVLDKMVDREISKRRKQVAKERSRKCKATVAKDVKKAFKVRAVSDLKCEESIKDMILRYMDDPHSLVGTLFLHTVDDSEYYGRVSHATSDGEMWVGYWGLEDSESTAVDHSIPYLSFFTDAVLGQVVFL